MLAITEADVRRWKRRKGLPPCRVGDTGWYSSPWTMARVQVDAGETPQQVPGDLTLTRWWSEVVQRQRQNGRVYNNGSSLVKAKSDLVRGTAPEVGSIGLQRVTWNLRGVATAATAPLLGLDAGEKAEHSMELWATRKPTAEVSKRGA